MIGLYAGEHAPKKLRYFDIVRRMEWLKKYLAIAQKNLVAAPASWNAEAIARNKALIEFINGELKADCAPELQPKFAEQAPKAVKELEEFGRWLESAMATTQREWRPEPAIYAVKAKVELGVKVEEAKRAAEEDLAKLRGAVRDAAAREAFPKLELKVMVAPAVMRVAGARLHPGAVLHPEQKSRVWVEKGKEDRLAMARVALRQAAFEEARKSEPRSRKVLRTVFEPAWKWERWPAKGAERELLWEAAKLWAQIEMVMEVTPSEEAAKKVKERTGFTTEEAAELVRQVEMLGWEIPGGYWGWRMEEQARGGRR